MPKRRKALAGVQRVATARSRVTNGRKLFLPGVDGRSALARRFRDIAASLVSDLGGPSHLSEAQMQLIRRCATMSANCELLEAKAASGEEIDLELHGKLTDRLGRALQRLGLRRVARDVTPNLRDYMEAAE